MQLTITGTVSGTTIMAQTVLISTTKAVKKHNLELALEACEALLNFPNLEIVSANREVVSSALHIIREYHLEPRDAIHTATAIAEKVDCVITTDAHFGRVKELKTKGLG